MNRLTLVLAPFLTLLAAPAHAHCGSCGVGGEDHDKHAHDAGHEAAEGSRVFFVAPADGATVKGPVTVKMGVEGMKVQPAGQLTEGTGHHHVIIDAGGVAKGTAVPADDQHIHFGKGQTEATLALSPGEHTLTLQFADGAHRSYGPDLAATIKVTVTE